MVLVVSRLDSQLALNTTLTSEIFLCRKEVSLISVLTALVVNFMLPNWPRVRNVLSVVREAGQPVNIFECIQTLILFL